MKKIYGKKKISSKRHKRQEKNLIELERTIKGLVS